MGKYTGHIQLQELFLRKATFEQLGVPATGPKPELGKKIDMQVSVNWWEREEDLVDVELGLQVNPEPEESQPYDVSVRIVGRFRFGELPEGLDETEFIQKNSVAIMMPFVREVIGNLTMRGSYGPLWLPPINVVAMLSHAEEEAPESREARTK